MIDSIPQIMEALEAAIHEAALDSVVDWKESLFLFVGYNSVQIVLSDASKTDAVETVVKKARSRLIERGIEFDFQVRAKWSLESIGEVQPLYGGDGELRAASVISVNLKSGNAAKVVYVIVTWAADKAIREIAPSADLRVVADAIIRSRLAPGGSNVWNPMTESTIEINAAAAPYVSRLLQQAA